jgi:hypothetical protein
MISHYGRIKLKLFITESHWGDIVMQDFEKLGVFYLGKEYDLTNNELKDDLILYDAKDLTTHAMIVGMTGSGKTGLAIGLLEEAAIDGIPSILIDPKGDLGNLLLQFPGLQPEDFRPWIDEAEAARKGMDPDAFAAKTAESWKNGLAQWGQEPERIQRLKDTVSMTIYTPGNTAGRPLQILRSFAPPSASILQDTSALRDRIISTISGLLSLLGIDADPVQSRDHILLSNILDQAWRDGRSLDIAGMIHEIQKPSFKKIGVFDLESFYPAKERFKLAISLNNLLASPGFTTWLEGEPLDIQRLLYTPEGKPRVSIISIAHLSDPERMFFVTLLLNEIVAWMRNQSGTSSLRALLYMDEIFGYFPPTANPPSKLPMLTLLKQARAFGLGVVLATQNPVDLDYKGLANCGTWFIGRLQTERDKLRVIEGLEGAAVSATGGFDRPQMEKILAGLGNRVFLMRNVHEQNPVVFQTRWAMSYLRGPLTLPQIQALSAGMAAAAPSPTPSRFDTPAYEAVPVPHPILPPDVQEYYLRPQGVTGSVVYRPTAIGVAKMHFVSARAKVDTWITRTLIAPLSEDGRDALWEEAELHGDLTNELTSEPTAEGQFSPLPTGVTNSGVVESWKKILSTHLYQHDTLTLMNYPELKLISKPEESEGDFRARVAQALREKRDLEVAKIKAKFSPKFKTLENKIRVSEERIEREKSQASQQKVSTYVSVGATLLGALLGRSSSVGTVGRAATAAKSMSRIGKEKAEVQRAQERLEELQEQLKALQEQFDEALAPLHIDVDPMSLDLHPSIVRPRKSDIIVDAMGICWVPSGKRQ